MRASTYIDLKRNLDPDEAFRLFDEAVASDDADTGCAMCKLVAYVSASGILWAVLITLVSWVA